MTVTRFLQINGAYFEETPALPGMLSFKVRKPNFLLITGISPALSENHFTALKHNIEQLFSVLSLSKERVLIFPRNDVQGESHLFNSLLCKPLMEKNYEFGQVEEFLKRKTYPQTSKEIFISQRFLTAFKAGRIQILELCNQKMIESRKYSAQFFYHFLETNKLFYKRHRYIKNMYIGDVIELARVHP